MNDKLKIKIGTFAELGSAITPLRDAVFFDEQGIPAGVLSDDENADICAVFAGETLAVTARLTANRIGQVAVKRGLRGKGYGKIAVAALIDLARERGAAELDVQAQTQAVGFYRKLGFAPCGKPYYEGKFELVDMKLIL